ncbi:MAG: hypothetical protein E6H77_12155 [Betaproteobacteria bacterium]|nr:MAG: hypothetical protein E6H77_12155 [Betaproteobacteria bacterium]
MYGGGFVLAIPVMVLVLSFAIVGPGHRLAWTGICAAALTAYFTLALLGAPPWQYTGGYELPAYKRVLQVCAGVVGVALLLLPLWAALFRRWRERR